MLRAIGWSRRRLLVLVVGEALIVSLLGAGAGVGLGFAAVAFLERLPDLLGVFRPESPRLCSDGRWGSRSG